MQWIVCIEPYDCVVCFLKFEEEARDENCCDSANGLCVSECLQNSMVSGVMWTRTGQ